MNTTDTYYGRKDFEPKPTAKPMKTADELVEECRRDNPGRKFARDKKGHAIGAWVEEVGRYVAFYMATITNEWVFSPIGFPWINGEPPVKNEDWIPV